jgi:predicted metal-dependent HD superfamily phosphohydrolase
MYEQILKDVQDRIVQLMRPLDSTHSYHNIAHTLDVLAQCKRIAAAEGITDSRELLLLDLAACYHDTGFLKIYKGHEKESCVFFLKDSHAFPLTDNEKVVVTDIIMATCLPQAPRTILEKIICDADLDYLGRTEFSDLAAQLKLEFITHGIVKNDAEWEQRQRDFLQSHQYHTHSSQALREPLKQQHYNRLIS